MRTDQSIPKRAIVNRIIDIENEIKNIQILTNRLVLDDYGGTLKMSTEKLIQEKDIQLQNWRKELENQP